MHRHRRAAREQCRPEGAQGLLSRTPSHSVNDVVRFAGTRIRGFAVRETRINTDFTDGIEYNTDDTYDTDGLPLQGKPPNLSSRIGAECLISCIVLKIIFVV